MCVCGCVCVCGVCVCGCVFVWCVCVCVVCVWVCVCVCDFVGTNSENARYVFKSNCEVIMAKEQMTMHMLGTLCDCSFHCVPLRQAASVPFVGVQR